MPFLSLTVFNDLFLQALILLDELVQTEIKLAADSYQVANIGDSFSAFPASNGRPGNLESFRQGFLSELMLLTDVFENLRDFQDDSFSNEINEFFLTFFIFIIKRKSSFANSICLTIQLFSITNRFSKVIHRMLTSLLIS